MAHVVVASVRWLHSGEATGSQTRGPGHMRQAGPHRHACARGWEHRAPGQQARTRPRFRRADCGRRPRGLVSGSLCGRHLPGQPLGVIEDLNPESVWPHLAGSGPAQDVSFSAGASPQRETVWSAASVPARTPAPQKSVRCRAPLPDFLTRSPWPGPAGTPSLGPSRAVNSRRGRTPCTLSGEPGCGLLPPEFRNVPSSPSSSLCSHGRLSL